MSPVPVMATAFLLFESMPLALIASATEIFLFEKIGELLTNLKTAL